MLNIVDIPALAIDAEEGVVDNDEDDLKHRDQHLILA